MKQPEWQFASTGGGTEDGVSNPELEYFEGDYNYFLAREILQNALDARFDKSNPVRVVFSLEQYSNGMFPGYEQFVNVWKNAQDHWPKENRKCHIFLQNGLDCLKSGKIDVLKISDFNTKGLNGGDNDRNGSWFGLVKSVGSSNKNEGEGGSFGIGKGAPFAASYLRTCFYSTINDLGQNVYQGVCKIVSHNNSKGEVKRGYGSFGLAKQSSVRNRRQISEHMVRKSRGLDIYVMGYKTTNAWQQKLLESVLRNFWPAIYHNELEVEIDGEVLNTKNLEEKLTYYFIEKPAKDNTRPEGNPLQFFRAYKNYDKVFEDCNAPFLKSIKLHFRKSEEHLNRIAMIRKSKMVIYTRPFRFPANYAGVFICDDEHGNQELRKMESPEHDRWDKDRYKEKGAEIDYELSNFIKGCLKSLTRIDDSEVLEIPGAAKYLPYHEEGNIQGSNGVSGEYASEESARESSKEIGVVEELDKDILVDPYNVSVINTPVEGLGGEGIVLGNKKRKRKKRKKTDGGGEGDTKSLLASNINSRVFLREQKDSELEYQVIIKSKLEGKCNLKFFAIGDEGFGKTKIIEVRDKGGNKYASSDHRIRKIPLYIERETTLFVRIRGRIKMSIKLEAYDLQ